MKRLSLCVLSIAMSVPLFSWLSAPALGQTPNEKAKSVVPDAKAKAPEDATPEAKPAQAAAPKESAVKSTKPAPAKESPDQADASAEIRKSSEEFMAAFLKGDGNAVADFWTEQGEYINDQGHTIQGREALREQYSKMFAVRKPVKAQATIDSIRFVGRDAAIEEGHVSTTFAGSPRAERNRYSILHVREGGKWKMAICREWLMEPDNSAALADLAWLVGDWAGKTEKGELHMSYSWGEGKSFLQNHFSVKVGGKTFASGLQLIAKDPMTGDIRSWTFGSGGALGEGTWFRHDNSWTIEAAVSLPDGTETASESIMAKISNDTFTWQSTNQVVADRLEDDAAPIRFNRVKAGAAK